MTSTGTTMACCADGEINRRVFVKAGGLALVALGLDTIFLTRAAYAVKRGRRSGAGAKTLVCLFQRGAVDGLNMVVPHGNPFYYRERPRIAIPHPGAAGGVLDLDGHFGLHPALAPLKPLYDHGSLAIVHAVGSPEGTRSHFDAQDYMESGTPGLKSTPDGWLNRYLGARHAAEHRDTPFRGVAIGPQLPRALRGAAPALAIEDVQAFGLRGPAPARDRLTEAIERTEQARDQAQRASQAIEQEMAGQAAASGTRAQKEFEELREEFRRRSSNRFSEDVRQLSDAANELNEKQKEYLGDILTSSKHLLQLVNDVLDLAKVESGKLKLHLEDVDLRMSIASTVAPFVLNTSVWYSRPSARLSG